MVDSSEPPTFFFTPLQGSHHLCSRLPYKVLDTRLIPTFPGRPGKATVSLLNQSQIPLAGMAQHSNIARSAIMTSATAPELMGDQRNSINRSNGATSNGDGSGSGKEGVPMHPPKTVVNRALGNDLHSDSPKSSLPPKGGVGTALTDTPVSTAPPSPQM